MAELQVVCADCCKELEESSNILVGEREPCPNCGSKRRIHKIGLKDEMKFHESIRARSFPPNSRKWKQQVKSGDSLFNSTKEWYTLKRIIDRANNLYVEEIKDKDGKTIKKCEEPLDEHRGHGSAKGKQKEEKKEGK